MKFSLCARQPSVIIIPTDVDLVGHDLSPSEILHDTELKNNFADGMGQTLDVSQ